MSELQPLPRDEAGEPMLSDDAMRIRELGLSYIDRYKDVQKVGHDRGDLDLVLQGQIQAFVMARFLLEAGLTDAEDAIDPVVAPLILVERESGDLGAT